MDWRKTLWKTSIAAAIAAIGILVQEWTGRTEAWAVVGIAALTLVRDWLKHRADGK